MVDIIEKLVDLHKQATTERSHYYVASCVKESIAEIIALRARIAELEARNKWLEERLVIDPGGSDKIDELEQAMQFAHSHIALLEKIREAAEPFAHDDLCEKLSGNLEGDESPIYGRNNALLKLGHFRRIRAALRAAKKEKE